MPGQGRGVLAWLTSLSATQLRRPELDFLISVQRVEAPGGWCDTPRGGTGS